MPIKPNAPVACCLYCGEAVKRKGRFYVCVECGERFEPDEVGFPEDMPLNPYRDDPKPRKDMR